jgi:MFS transporter, NNP family, nitrate/nitrite transporter
MKLLLLFFFWSLWYINFSTRTILSPLLPLIEDELSIDHGLAGSIFAFMSVGYTASLLLSGALSSRIGYKRSMAVGLTVLSLSLFGLHYAPGYKSLAVTCLFIGLGAGVYLPCVIPLLTAAFDRNHWGKVIAFHDTAASLSILSVPLLVVFGLQFLQWRSLFSVLGIATLLGLLCFFILSPDVPLAERNSTGLLCIIRRRDFWIMSILWIFAAACTLGIYNMIPLFLVKGNQIPLQTANTILGLSRTGGFVAVMLAGFLADKFGVKKVLFSVLLITGLSTAALAFAPPFAPLITILIIQATVSPAFFPVALAAISRMTGFTERSTFTGATSAVGAVFGLGLTPAALGAIADVWNFNVGFLLFGLLTCLSCLLLKGISWGEVSA